MHLIAPLSVGVRGARNGTVFAYERGTDTPAPTWADASGKIRRHGALRLDMWGTISLYVDRLVDIVVYDSTMLLVRSWTDGRSAGAVVVEHPAFTGVRYETGEHIVGERTTLVEALGRWDDSAGADDFNVIYKGSTYPVYVAIGDVAGVFFDPRDFGATGDGSGNDTGPIQAAIDSARAAGGGIVYLAPGTYVITSALALHANVSLVGEGASSTFIKTTSITDPLMYIFGGDAPELATTLPSHSLSGVSMSASAFTAQNMVWVRGGNTVITGCVFDGTLSTGNLLRTEPAEGLRVDSCTFIVVGETSTAIDSSESTPQLRRGYVDNCVFVAPVEHVSVRGLVGTARFHLDGSIFDLGLSTTGIVQCVRLAGLMQGIVDGCEMTASAGSTATLLHMENLNQNAERIFEDCSLCDNSSTFTLTALNETNTGTLYWCRLKTVEARHSPVITDPTETSANLVFAPIPDASQYGIFSVKFTSGAFSTGDSSVVINAASGTTTYNGSINQGRAIDVLLYMAPLAAGDTFSVNENRYRNSVIPAFGIGADRMVGLKMLCTRVASQGPSVADLTRLYCLTMGNMGAGSVAVPRSGYGPI